MVFVGNGGKLFERLSRDKYTNSKNRYRSLKTRHTNFTASFCHRHENNWDMDYRNAERASFATFLARQEK